jgi:hypothetical protein
MGAAAVGAGQVGQQDRRIGAGRALGLELLVERFGHHHLVDAPFLGGGVVAVQVDPGAGRGLAAGTVELQHHLAGVMHATLADQRQARLHGLLAGAQLGHLGIGPRRRLPQRQHLAEGLRLGRRRRQGLAGVAQGDLVLQEGQRRAQRLEHLEVIAGGRRAVRQPGEQGDQRLVRLAGVGQRQAGDQGEAGARVGGVDRQRRRSRRGAVHPGGFPLVTGRRRRSARSRCRGRVAGSGGSAARTARRARSPCRRGTSRPARSP